MHPKMHPTYGTTQPGKLASFFLAVCMQVEQIVRQVRMAIQLAFKFDYIFRPPFAATEALFGGSLDSPGRNTMLRDR